MKIEKFEVIGLFGRESPISLTFKQDLNILTGKNGAGKTTILKLMWYMISGNLEKALIEVPFSEASLETDIYIFKVKVREEQDIPFETELSYKNLNLVPDYIQDLKSDQINPHVKHVLMQYVSHSYFFPTFRVIEGGFSTQKYNIKHELLKILLNNNSEKNPDNIDIENDFRLLSNKLSNRGHRFIASVSASGIEPILISKYADIMSQSQPYQLKRHELISNLLKLVKEDNESSSNSNDILNRYDKEIAANDNELNLIKEPLNRFHKSISFFLDKYDFHFGEKIQFSFKEKNKQKISYPSTDVFSFITKIKKKSYDINTLSSGEKQIFTFIGLNSFIDDTIFFIDEPENSLHADWQRILFRILMKQNPTNQFIITTHSPFIYSKYSDKEVCIDVHGDRGNQKEEYL